MHRLLDDYLCNKYPKIFVERKLSVQDSCMGRGFECDDGWFHLLDSLCSSIQTYIDYPAWPEIRSLRKSLGQLWNKTAWNHVLYPLLKKLNLSWPQYSLWQNRLVWNGALCRRPTEKDKVPQVVFLQVKEKFGTLRIYTKGGDEYTSGLIDLASSLSYHVCEICGKFDETVNRNESVWVRTTCPKCTQKERKDEHWDNRDHDLIEIWKKVKADKKKKS